MNSLFGRDFVARDSSGLQAPSLPRAQGAASKAPTCAVPMHAPQASTLGEGLGRGAARVKCCVEGGYSQGHFESLPRGGWMGCLVLSDEWLVRLCKSAHP